MLGRTVGLVGKIEGKRVDGLDEVPRILDLILAGEAEVSRVPGQRKRTHVATRLRWTMMMYS